MFDRLETLIGNKITILKNKAILLIGLGGVGGHAFETLVRSGFEKIIVVDNDIIDVTNINRQALAFQITVGKEKTDIAKNMAKNINPNCTVITKKLFLTEENIEEVFNTQIDFVIDAIDAIQTKKAIIKKCLNQKIPFISVMGTANKMHPELLEIKDIRQTEYDPIARIIRKMVKEEKIKGKIPVIFSKEKPIIKDKLGSTAFVPATAGIMAASYVVNKILEDNYE